MVVHVPMLDRRMRRISLKGKRSVVFYLLNIAFFVFLAFSCETRNQGQNISLDTLKIKDTIKLYNALLADGYRNHNMNPLVQVATEQRATKAYYHMAALGEAGVKMDSFLKEIKFVTVQIVEPANAAVETEEIWDYAYIDIDSKKQVYDNSVTYKMSYKLIKQNEKWIVEEAEARYSKEKKEEKYSVFRESPRGKSREK